MSNKKIMDIVYIIAGVYLCYLSLPVLKNIIQGQIVEDIILLAVFSLGFFLIGGFLLVKGIMGLTVKEQKKK